MTILTVTAITLVLIAAGVFGYEVLYGGENKRLDSYLPEILGLCLEGLLFVVILGAWQQMRQRSRRRRLLKELSHQLGLMAFVMKNAVEHGSQNKPCGNKIASGTYRNLYESMKKIQEKWAKECATKSTGSGCKYGGFPKLARSVADEVLDAAQLHLERLRYLTPVVAEFGEVNLGEWVNVTDMLYNIARYAEAARSKKRPIEKNEEAEFAYGEIAALFSQLDAMRAPEYESMPERKGDWGT